MTSASDSIGRLVCVGIRGGRPGVPVLESDLDSCVEAGVSAVILFDVDVPEMLRLQRAGAPPEDASRRAPRNIHSPEQLRDLTAHVRSRLGNDSLICIDQEGGPTSRLKNERGFDQGVSARAFARLTRHEQQIEAQKQAAQLSDVGIDLNLAPCVDLALEPESSIIARLDRSFGEDQEVVTACAREFVRALTDKGVGACLKHFPGHGSARGDTHEGLVDVTETARPAQELTPYRDLLVGAPDSVAVMVAHVFDRRVDAEFPASLSPVSIDGALRHDLGFTGLVVTDSIDMAAIANHWTAGDAAVRAIRAGADLVIDGFNLCPDRATHPARSIVSTIRDAVQSGQLPMSRVIKSVERIDRFRIALSRNSAPTPTQ